MENVDGQEHRFKTYPKAERWARANLPEGTFVIYEAGRGRPGCC